MYKETVRNRAKEKDEAVAPHATAWNDHRGYLNPLATWVSVGPELPMGSPRSSLRFCLRK